MQHPMRFLLYVCLVFFAAAGCKKKVESVKEDLLVKLIVEGQWAVTKYTRGSADVTAEFSPYSFQFNRNFTVDALNNNIVETTGTWNGDITTKTITSNFPNPNLILVKLNGNWLVTDSGLTYVECTQTINGDACFLRLVKR